MSHIEPFRAIRYATQPAAADISGRIAPPYDVLDAADKKALLDRDASNFVKIDLPYVPPKHAGPPAVYEQAAADLRQWLAQGVMVSDSTPAIYPYYQRFTHAGREYARKKFFARLRLEPFGAGSVFPHELTFGGPKEDRLSLMKATRANLSPIFGLYEDASNSVANRLEAALPKNPLAYGTLDQVESRMWSVSDPAVVADVVQMMRSRPIFIADGHHRYGTSLLYRDWLRTQGEIPDNHPANYVLTVFCAMEDPGLLILPTHRVLPGLALRASTLQSDQNLEVTSMPSTSPEAAVRELTRFGPQAVALFSATDNSYVAVRPRDPNLLKQWETSHSDAWRHLGLAFLHAYLLDRVVTPQITGGKAPDIHYVKAAEPSVAEARSTNGSVFLLQPTTMDELRAVCKAGDLMPQKSTFFWPKLASGMLVNPLT